MGADEGLGSKQATGWDESMILVALALGFLIGVIAIGGLL